MYREEGASTPRLQKSTHLLRTQIRTFVSSFSHQQQLRIFPTNHTFKMSSPSLPPYKAICESAEEAQRLADDVGRFAASLGDTRNDWLSVALANQKLTAAVLQLQGYIGQRALLGQNAGLSASNAAIQARVAELEQQLGAARPAQPATTSGDGRGDHGRPRRHSVA